MITKRGSQSREPIEDTNLVFLRMGPDDNSRILRDRVSLTYELWIANDGYAGYVVVIQGMGYEFVRSLTEAEVLAMD